MLLFFFIACSVFHLHPQRKDFVGYVLHIDGKNFISPGETEVIPELLELTDLDLAMVPIDEEKSVFTTSTQEAIIFINQIKPKVVIPIHYSPGKGHEDFRNGIEDGIEKLSFGVE